MSKIESRLQELGITLPDSPSPMANYVPVVRTGNLIYLSGVGPAAKSDGSEYKGMKAGSFGDASVFSFYPTKVLGYILRKDEINSSIFFLK